ncbi:MarR family winged helix-turn-helix transcriptional regulator [Microbacterium sp. KHB019]|uniref:MarR family winged helix-turn-helix transcriptional regulator n=1 Tax=Microbacterium sp. KHB019 TaxID=3129770 RepID=UPI003079573F
MTDQTSRATLTGDDLETWSSLATVLEWLPAALDAQLQVDSDVTHFEYGILYALGDAPEHRLRMSVLAGYANSSLSRLSRAAARLEKRGWMQRMPDPTDGRYTLAILTEPGLAQVERATPGHVRTVRRLVLDPLTSAQRKQLLEISRRVQHAIRGSSGWTPAATE